MKKQRSVALSSSGESTDFNNHGEYARAVNSKMRDLGPVVLSSLLPTVRALLITRGAEVTALRGNMWD